MPTSCSNGVQDSDESGIDCGGSCPPCTAPLSCTNGIQDGDETGVDCGGSCPACSVAPSCANGLQDGDETGLDCGGSCPECASCEDGVQNQGEEEIDCGGPCAHCLSPLGDGVSYYVANDGDDQADGTSPETAWQSIARVNAMAFEPGDNILFKRGDRWEESLTLLVTSSGTDPDRITYGAYGSGPKPILSLLNDIPDWQSPASWESHADEPPIWRIPLEVGGTSARIRLRAWFDGVEYKRAQTANGTVDNAGSNDPASGYYVSTPNRYVGVDEEDRFFHATSANGTDYFYVYAPSTPATFYHSMKGGTTNDFQYVVLVDGASYITLQALDLRHGMHTIVIDGADHVIVEGCDVAYAAERAIWLKQRGSVPSSNAILRYNRLDSGFSELYGGPYDYYSVGHMGMTGSSFLTVSFGVGMMGAVDNEVHDNEMVDFYFAGVRIAGDETNTSARNDIHDNRITHFGINMGRGFHTSSYAPTAEAEGVVTQNRFFRNYVAAPGINAFQIGGDHNEIFLNIVDETQFEDPPLYGGRGDIANVLSGAGTGQGLSVDNKFYNNVFYNAQGFGIGWGGRGTLVANNLFLNVGLLRDGLNNIYVPTDNREIRYLNNLFFYEGKASTEPLVEYNSTDLPYPDYRMNIADWNGRNGESSDVISGNLQVAGSIDDIVVDAPGGDFRLTAASAAINAGVDVGLSEDYGGNPLVGLPDIGAFESP